MNFDHNLVIDYSHLPYHFHHKAPLCPFMVGPLPLAPGNYGSDVHLQNVY